MYDDGPNDEFLDLDTHTRNTDLLKDRPRRTRYDLKESQPEYWVDISGNKLSLSDGRWLCTFEPEISRALYSHLFRGLSRETALVMEDMAPAPDPQLGFREELWNAVSWEECAISGLAPDMQVGIESGEDLDPKLLREFRIYSGADEE